MTSYREIEHVTELLPPTACKISRGGCAALLLLTDTGGLEVVAQHGEGVPDLLVDQDWIAVLNSVCASSSSSQ